MKGLTVSTLFLVAMLVSSCSFQPQQNNAINLDWFPPAGFKDSDLIGTWSSESEEDPSAEILTLHENQIFMQTFTIHSTVHGPTLLAQNGNREPDGTPFPLWDGCQKRLVEMPDFVLLGIGHDSTHNSRIFLYHMSLDAETSPPVLWKNDPTVLQL
jgi:hypothetical protein